MIVQLAVIALALFFAPGEGRVSDTAFENCMFLGNNRLELEWTVRREASAIDFQICGCDSGDEGDPTAPNEYMAFGLSGNTTMTQMRGADATIAWVDNEQGAMAQDYFLSDYLPCADENGACPDTRYSGCTDDISNISGFKREGLQCVSFTRSFTTTDTRCDTNFDVDNQNQYIVWAVGGQAETAFRHFRRANSDESPIHLGRNASNQCQGGLICPNCPPFQENIIDATGRDETFVAHIGPPANPRGYMSIADQAGWGIAWYINNTLIPNIHVERGYTYTFVTYSGMEGDGNNYHPFYLTDSRTGGRDTLSDAQRVREVVYAGFDDNGDPLGVGTFCDINETPTSTNILNTCGPQADYLTSLNSPQCPSDASPGRFMWTPDESTPNTVYYQCATHRNLGYKLTVMPLIEDSGAPRLMAYAATMVLMILLTFAL